METMNEAGKDGVNVSEGLNFVKRYPRKTSWRSDLSEDLKWMRDPGVYPTEEKESAEALV